MTSDYSRVVAVAAEVVGKADRGLGEIEAGSVRQIMRLRNLAEEQFYEDVCIIIDVMVGYAMNLQSGKHHARLYMPAIGSMTGSAIPKAEVPLN